MEQAAQHCHGAMCKSWMTVRKAHDKLLNFCWSARKRFEESWRRTHTFRFARSLSVFVLLFEWALPDYRGAKIEKVQMELCVFFSWLHVFTCFQWDGVGGLESNPLTSIYFREQQVYITWPDQSWGVHTYTDLHRDLHRYTPTPLSRNTWVLLQYTAEDQSYI